jgi:hypothetical protein
VSALNSRLLSLKPSFSFHNIMSDEIPFPGPFDVLSERNASGGDLSQFLKDNIFGSKKDDEDEYDADAVNRVTHTKEPSLSEQNKGGIFKLMSAFQGAFGSDGKKGTASKASSILDIAKNFNNNVNSTLKESESNQDIDMFWKLLQECKEQWSTVAADSKVRDLNPLAFMYFLGFEESRKTPSYRRREHRFYASLEVETLHDLHNALYLATISYLHTVEEISKALQDFNGSPWVMVYCDVASKPREPAHYICLKKEQEKVKDEGFRFPWQKEEVLDVLMVVRGTKEISDVLSDALIETSPYKGGLAHGGIQKAGDYLVEKHTPFLETLLKESKRDKIRLSIVGHSLGAGAGAIAAIEFNKLDYVDAKAIGFGCPPILSEELSESTKEYITTVVCDSDVVPRMSGATISNVVMDVMSRPYKEMAMVDVHQILEAIDANSPIKPSKEQKESILQHVEKGLDEDFEKYKVEYDPVDVVLFPPGKCIHLYRDGTGISGAYVPCTFFNEIDVNRTMILDHGTADGYDTVFHELMRGHLHQIHFKFPHDVAKATAMSS